MFQQKHVGDCVAKCMDGHQLTNSTHAKSTHTNSTQPQNIHSPTQPLTHSLTHPPTHPPTHTQTGPPFPPSLGHSSLQPSAASITRILVRGLHSSKFFLQSLHGLRTAEQRIPQVSTCQTSLSFLCFEGQTQEQRKMMTLEVQPGNLDFDLPEQHCITRERMPGLPKQNMQLERFKRKQTVLASKLPLQKEAAVLLWATICTALHIRSQET